MTAPGYVSPVMGERDGFETSTAHSNAAISGKVFATWFSKCTRLGLRRPVRTRSRFPWTFLSVRRAQLARQLIRARCPSWRRNGPLRGRRSDLPAAVFPRLSVPPGRRYAPVGRSPWSLSGKGYLYQYAFRFAALVQLLASVWLAPTASYCNRVMFTEVVARAMEARRRQMCAGPHKTYGVERYDISGAPRAYKSALDSFVGTVLFGSVVDNER